MPRPPRRPDGRPPARSKGAPPSGGRKPHRGAPETRPDRDDARPPRRGREDGPKAVHRPDPGGPPRAARGEMHKARGDARRGTGRDEARDDAPRGVRSDAPRPARGAGFGRAETVRTTRGDAPRGKPMRHQAEAPEAPIDDTPAPPRPGAGAGSGAFWIYGHHAVLAALSNPRRKPRRLLTTTDAELALRDAFTGRWRVTPERADRARFATFLTEDAVHQGIALLAEPLEPVQLEDAIEANDGPVLLLDQVTDPRNVGAALRAAAAFGAACVVLQDRHAPSETGTLARAASGALDIVPVVREVNLSRAITALQRAGFWVMGLAGEAKRTLAEAAPRDRRIALVMGAEDHGLRRLQRETVDELVRLPMAEGVESLNVASAAAVALYEVVRR